MGAATAYQPQPRGQKCHFTGIARSPRPFRRFWLHFRIGTVCYSEETAALLVPITRELDIGPYVAPTPALDSISDELIATVLR